MLLDCKTRWNSLVAMFERYLGMRSHVENISIYYKINNPIIEEEYVALAAIACALKHLKHLKRLCFETS